MEPFLKFMLIALAFLAACFIGGWFLLPDSSAFAPSDDHPPQSVVFKATTCTDIIENPRTETIWGDVSNGYRCGHE